MITHRMPRALTKPPRGAQINWSSPFARKLLLCVPFSEGCWNDSDSAGRPVVLWGSAMRQDTGGVSSSSHPVWTGNADGVCLRCVGTNDEVTLGPDFLPTNHVTIAIIRRNLDTTLRPTGLFGFGFSEAAANRCGAHVPYADGVIYWDFGGFAGANRLTYSGYTKATGVERWVFTAGPRGSAIWLNGVKLASQSTAITRSLAVSSFSLNSGNGGNNPDDLDLNFFLAVDDQWDDAMIRAWSADPYALLYPPSLLRVDNFVGGGASVFPWQRAYSVGFR